MTRTNGKSPAKKKTAAAAIPLFAVAPSDPPPHMIVGDQFVAQTEFGAFGISLRMKERTIRLMEDLPLSQQFDIAVAELAPEWTARIPEMEHVEVLALRQKWITAVFQWQGARLGEYFGSSTS